MTGKRGEGEVGEDMFYYEDETQRNKKERQNIVEREAFPL
jgi:hypothetical protein